MIFSAITAGQFDPLIRLIGEWAASLTAAGLVFRIILALVLSAIIGCERATKRHSAGLRTFMLLSLSCTVIMMIDEFLYATTQNNRFILSAAAVIALSIICVNSLLVSARSQIKGLTTAVAMWACGIMSLAVGAGFYTPALIVFIALMITLSVFPRFEGYLKNRSNHFEIHLELTDSSYLQDFVTTIRKLSMRIDDIELNPAYAGSGLSVYTVSITIGSDEVKKYKTHTELIEALGTLKYIYHIEEMRL
ncbi:MAG: MgtC/SapB family protein [Eubacterium sp.]|nr:MgtC/SapB family protein [Eubacterium sp.]